MGYSSKPFTQRKRLSAHANSQLASVKLKRKQLFLFYREIIDAQIQLRVFCEEIVKFFGKEKVKLSSPPGAHLGIKTGLPHEHFLNKKRIRLTITFTCDHILTF